MTNAEKPIVPPFDKLTPERSDAQDPDELTNEHVREDLGIDDEDVPGTVNDDETRRQDG